jgi:1-acyl-sn-glycerol-3-phosphate acyltransferase
MLILIFSLIGLLIAVPVGLNASLWLALAAFLGAFLFQALLMFLFLLYLCSRVDQNVPQEQDDPLYRKVADLILESVLPILRIHIEKRGLEKMPKEGRFLLVSNHCNNSDPIILMRALRKYPLAFISKRENKDMFVIGPMMHKLMAQLINRENDREALKTILKCIEILKQDKASVAVFPEGGILTEDGRLHHFKPGVFKIAQKAGVPIVVCVLKDTKDVVHNLLRLRPSKVTLKVLDVIPVETVQSQKTVELAEMCHELMSKELGPELVFD